MSKPVVLCVDDEQVILDTLSSQLRLAFGPKCRLEIAGGVEEAWEVIRDLKERNLELKMVISDWLMPPHRGDHFLKEVYDNWPDVKLVMLSGQADDDATERVKMLPSLLAFIRKPWEKNEVVDIVAQVIT